MSKSIGRGFLALLSIAGLLVIFATLLGFRDTRSQSRSRRIGEEHDRRQEEDRKRREREAKRSQEHLERARKEIFGDR